jgi:hypothetical protein
MIFIVYKQLSLIPKQYTEFSVNQRGIKLQWYSDIENIPISLSKESIWLSLSPQQFSGLLSS